MAGKKRLDVTTVLTDFTGKPIKENGQDQTLRDAIIGYLNQLGHLIFTPFEQMTAFEMGRLVGAAETTVELNQAQYDALKKICDKPERPAINGQPPLAVSALVVTQQVKQLVDAADNVEESPE